MTLNHEDQYKRDNYITNTSKTLIWDFSQRNIIALKEENGR